MSAAAQQQRSASCISREIDPSVKTLLPLVPFAYFSQIKRSSVLFVLFIWGGGIDALKNKLHYPNLLCFPGALGGVKENLLIRCFIQTRPLFPGPLK